ncbi:MAG TPA: TetR/AcrR family transcriptional regulator [Nitrospirota bacterium]|nr:TetR/AcrR family transcriptional regulator [Nitrospirota bacterium]
MKKLRGEIRRDLIVQAAFAVISRSGVGGLTTAALAREAGISEGNLYRHFRNKEAIISEAMAYVKGRISDNIDRALSGKGAPLEKLRKFYELQLDLMARNSGILRFMFSDELHTSEKFREKLLENMYAFSSTLAAFMKKAQKAGSLRRGLDAKTMSLMFIGMVQGLMFRWSLSGFSFSLIAEGRKMWKIFEVCIAA